MSDLDTERDSFGDMDVRCPVEGRRFDICPIVYEIKGDEDKVEYEGHKLILELLEQQSCKEQKKGKMDKT